MDATADALEESPATYELPCSICRRRKVRCSKTLPCDNCERAGAVCLYDNSTRSSRQPTRYTDLTTRLSRVESLMRRSNLPKEQNVSRNNDEIEPTDIGNATIKTMQDLINMLDHKFKQQLAPLNQDLKMGKLAFVEGSSRYIQAGFWAGRYEEIQNLKYLLDEPASTASDFLFSAPSFSSPYQSGTLSRSQGDFLVQSFVLYVDPFVRLSHKPRLLLDLNHFRRGILPDGEDFECELSVIYALGLVPLTEEECILRLGGEKSALMKNFKYVASRGLARLNVASSHKIRNLRTFLLYITLLFWTGEMAQASGLLGLALRFARRLGIHRDGSLYKLSPWRVEMMRRLWHHIVLIDTWCVENEGAESMILAASYDTALPQCSNDASWDACEFALEGPSPSGEFTDMTGALVQYEIALVVQAVLNHTSIYGGIETSHRYQQDLVLQARKRIEATYLINLDIMQPPQKIVIDLTALAFEKLFFTINQPLFKHGIGGNFATPELQSELFDRAIAYCETVQRLREEYSPHHLDWIFIRSFSWDSVTIMLTSILKNHASELTERVLRARGRIDRLFQNRHTIDYLAGNGNLWIPLQKLWEELKTLENSGYESDAQVHGIAVADEWPMVSLDFDIDYHFPLD